MKFLTKKIKIIIIASLIFTLPLSVFFTIWTTRTIHTYFIFEHIQPNLSVPKGPRFYRIGIMQFIALKEEFFTSIGIKNHSDINLYLDKNDYGKIKNDPMQKEKYESKSYLLYGENFIKGKAKLRGDNYYHWAYPHKSWRFKTSKKNLLNGIQKNNFMILKSNGIFANHLAYTLANTMNLLAPKSSLQTLNINNANNGLKLVVGQIDESFLRSKRRMPNDIYKGDNVSPKKNLGLTISDVFNAPSIWEKPSYNNHYDRNSKLPLYKLRDDLNTNKHALLDKKSFSSLMVFIDLIGSLHYDAQHNWVIYYDNYYEKFYPIIWDPLAWHEEWLKKNYYNISSGSKLLENLYYDYSFLTMKYDTFYTFFKNKDAFISLLNSTYLDTLNKLNEITYSYKAGGGYRDTKTVQKDATNLKNNILDRLVFLENTFLGQVKKDDYHYSIVNDNIRLSIKGDKLIEKIIIKYKNDFDLEDIQLAYLINNIIEKHSIKYKQNNANMELILEQKLLAKTRKKVKQMIFEEATYDIIIPKLSPSNVVSVSLQFKNTTHELLKLKKIQHIAMQKFSRQKNIIISTHERGNEVWSGIKEFTHSKIISHDIVIQKGTHIILDNNVTIKILGKVTAIGTKKEPILFEAKDKTKPWNTLALKDAQANGSTFKHCIFKDGSGEKGDLYEYTAMFSIHNVKNLLVEDCEFYDSHKTDDMVHVIYSDAVFKNTKFIRSLSDALDVDISNLLVDNCEFIDSGNDAIDLMTTNAVVINSKFTNSKDKGISIGEGSNLLAINNHIKGSEIGMQSKDTSKAYIYNTTFIANKKAIDAYHKNWRYNEGGSIYLEKCIFENNTYNATVGKKSRVVINNSQIDTLHNFDKKSLKKSKIIVRKEKEIVPNLPTIDSDTYSNLIHDKMGYYGN